MELRAAILKRKLMRKEFFGFALCAMHFALCLPAHAQQPAKVPRIGFLANTK